MVVEPEGAVVPEASKLKPISSETLIVINCPLVLRLPAVISGVVSSKLELLLFDKLRVKF